MRVTAQQLKPGMLYQSQDNTLCIYLNVTDDGVCYLYEIPTFELISINENQMMRDEIVEILFIPE